MGRRIAVGIEYDGSAYRGWQAQRGATSVQATLEAALARVADHPVHLTCAGRTDAGVHARGQVAHFDAEADRSQRAWLLGTNTHLPRDISLSWVEEVPQSFHARYSALSRSYRYLILNRGTRSALASQRALVVYRPLQIEPMQAAAQMLLGQHDFSAFRSSECQSRTPVRILHSLQVTRREDWIYIDVTANAFLHHMVRNFVGLLLVIGLGDAAPERAREQLLSRRRSDGEATAAAHGLYLWQVRYGPQFGLPTDSAMIDAPLAVGPE